DPRRLTVARADPAVQLLGVPAGRFPGLAAGAADVRAARLLTVAVPAGAIARRDEPAAGATPTRARECRPRLHGLLLPEAVHRVYRVLDERHHGHHHAVRGDRERVRRHPDPDRAAAGLAPDDRESVADPGDLRRAAGDPVGQGRR